MSTTGRGSHFNGCEVPLGLKKAIYVCILEVVPLVVMILRGLRYL